MAKAQSDDIREKRGETMMAAFDPSQALSGLEPLFHAGNRWLEGWVAVGSEILEFSRSRLDRNLEVSKAIVRSSSIDQAMDVQADYARTVLRDYFAEATKLADLSTRAMFDSLMAWQPSGRSETAQRRSAA